MKVAIVLAGHMRTFSMNLPYFKETILKPFEPDVYLESWDTYGYWASDKLFNNEDYIDPEKVKSNVPNVVYFNIDKYEDHAENLKERGDLFEETKVVYNKQPGGAVRPTNVVSMWYKRWKGIQAVLDSGIQYDRVILTRFDVRLANTPNITTPQMEISDKYNDAARGFADIFFNGSQQQLADMADIYNHLEETIEDKQEFCGHTLMRWWLKKRNIPFVIKPYQITIFNTPTGYCKPF